MSQLQFESYYNNNYDALLSFAMKLTRNRMDAEDLIQETAIKAYRNFNKFIEGSNFKNWTFTILKNTFLSKYRKRQRINIVSAPVEEMEFAIKQENNSNDNVKQSVAKVTKCIESLSEKSKEPFKMYINGNQYSEISESLDIPIGTVKSRIHFARTKLKTLLNNK